MLVVSLCAAIPAQAVDYYTTAKKVAQIKSRAAEYIVANDTNTDYSAVSNASALWTLIKAGQDMSSVKESFAANIKSNLDANEGKIVIEGANWYQDENDQWYSVPYSYEDIAVYGAVLLVLDSFGYDTTNFEGYNLQNTFKDFDLSKISNPYTYRVAVEAASDILGDADFAKSLIGDMINRFYDKGKGLNNWGYSCDNTAQFLMAIGNQSDLAGYIDYISDAEKVIDHYTLTNYDDGVVFYGAFCDDTYVTAVNADSTALAMGGLASVGQISMANWYYACLMEFYDSQTGAFTTLGEDNLIATKDALLGLICFENAVKTYHDFSKDEVVLPASFGTNGIIVERCTVCGEQHNTEIHGISTEQLMLTGKSYTTDGKVKLTYNGKAQQPSFWVVDNRGITINHKNYYDVTYKNNKNVGTATATIKFKFRYSGTYTEEFVINPKGTALSKITAANKGFTVNWKKQATQTTGYQIQYSTSSKFTAKTAKTVTVKSNKTTKRAVSKLKKNKKYFVRVRTYKTVKGKNYYSAWSKSKSVKTK